MCGIAGVINFRDVVADEREGQEVRALIGRLNHRGPDNHGVRLLSPRAVLGACRLAITDHANVRAHMPFFSSDGRTCLVYNGEIYNFQELRRELSSYVFETASDTEVILAAYRKWGRACIDRFYGMFAFCLFDLDADIAWLAVDQAGQKPLYVLQDQRGIVFCSEISPLIADESRSCSIDRSALAEIVARRYTIGADTHIQEIQRVEPGSELIVDTRVHKRRYYQIPIGGEKIKDAREAIEALTKTSQMIARQTLSREVPAALLLSGGIDSSLVAAFAERGCDLPSVSLGFDAEGDFGFTNETSWAENVAKHFGLRHKTISLSIEAYIKLIPEWIRSCGEPLASYEAVCLLHLFRQLAGSCKVAFCGSGADEIFDGYGNGFLLQEQGITAATLPAAYASSFNWLYDVELSRLMPHDNPREKIAAKLENFLEPYRASQDVIELTQLLNFFGRGASYEFRQVDVTSMASSIEVRSPWGDRRLVELAFRIASGLKNRDSQEKWIWKEMGRALLPKEITDRKKFAFSVPPAVLLHPAFEALVEPLLKQETPLSHYNLLDFQYLREIWQRRDPNTRNVFYRLLVLDGVLAQQGGA